MTISLKTQMAADMTAFFNTGEFADAATHTSVDGTETSITAICAEVVSEEIEGERTDTRTIAIQKSDVSAPDLTDTITIGSDEWSLLSRVSEDDNVAVFKAVRKVSVDLHHKGYVR